MSTVTETVIFQLRERVLAGIYPPGARLQEADLAKDLNVSRTPIRDALRVLASEELLVYSPNRGYAVRDVGIQDVIDAYDIRATLEGMACRILAERGINEELAAKLDTLIERGDSIVNGPIWSAVQEDAWSALNTEFHTLLAVATHNKALEIILRQVRRIPRMFDSRLHPNTEFFKSIYTHDQRRRSHGEHCRIIEVLKLREGSRAEALMREHVRLNRDLLRKSYPLLANTAPATRKRRSRQRA